MKWALVIYMIASRSVLVAACALGPLVPHSCHMKRVPIYPQPHLKLHLSQGKAPFCGCLLKVLKLFS